MRRYRRAVLNVREQPSLPLSILLPHVHISSNNHNNNALLSQQPCLSSPFFLSSLLPCRPDFTCHRQLTVHAPPTPTHTLNARTPTRELHARSPARQALELRSAVVPARSPQPSEPAKAKRSSLLLHRDRNGSVRERNARKARQGRQSIPRTPQRGAGRAACSTQFPPLRRTLCVCVRAAVGLPYILPTAAGSPNHQQLPSIGCLHMHYEFKADGRAGGSSPTHLSETSIVLRRCLVRLVMDAVRDCE